MLYEFGGHIRTDNKAGSGGVLCAVEPAVQPALELAGQTGIIICGGSGVQQAPQPVQVPIRTHIGSNNEVRLESCNQVAHGGEGAGD